MSSRQSIHIEAPVETVFDWFKDPRNWHTVTPAEPVQQSQAHVPEEGLGTFHVGAIRLFAVQVEFFGVFTEFIPNERIVDKMSLPFEGTWTYTFDREGPGTRVTMQRHPRSFWRLWPLDKLVDLVEGPGTQHWLAKVKEHMEATGVPATAAG